MRVELWDRGRSRRRHRRRRCRSRAVVRELRRVVGDHPAHQRGDLGCATPYVNVDGSSVRNSISASRRPLPGSGSTWPTTSPCPSTTGRVTASASARRPSTSLAQHAQRLRRWRPAERRRSRLPPSARRPDHPEAPPAMTPSAPSLATSPGIACIHSVTSRLGPPTSSGRAVIDDGDVGSAVRDLRRTRERGRPRPMTCVGAPQPSTPTWCTGEPCASIEAVIATCSGWSGSR